MKIFGFLVRVSQCRSQESAGIFQNADEVAAWPTQIGAAPGRIKYVDLNGDKVINSLDQDWIGTTLPKLEYGLRVNLGYKNS